MIITATAHSDFVDVADAHSISTKPLELPAKGVTELDRLAYVIQQVENDCQIVPVGSFKMIPTKEVRRNEAFKGLNCSEAQQLGMF